MTGPVPLRDKLHQAVHGFSQLASCLCQGALVQVRPSATCPRTPQAMMRPKKQTGETGRLQGLAGPCLAMYGGEVQPLEHVIAFQAVGCPAADRWPLHCLYSTVSNAYLHDLPVPGWPSHDVDAQFSEAPAIGHASVSATAAGLCGDPFVSCSGRLRIDLCAS